VAGKRLYDGKVDGARRPEETKRTKGKMG
jgi:hypothetical protein